MLHFYFRLQVKVSWQAAFFFFRETRQKKMYRAIRWTFLEVRKIKSAWVSYSSLIGRLTCDIIQLKEHWPQPGEGALGFCFSVLFTLVYIRMWGLCDLVCLFKCKSLCKSKLMVLLVFGYCRFSPVKNKLSRLGETVFLNLGNTFYKGPDTVTEASEAILEKWQVVPCSWRIDRNWLWWWECAVSKSCS